MFKTKASRTKQALDSLLGHLRQGCHKIEPVGRFRRAVAEIERFDLLAIPKIEQRNRSEMLFAEIEVVNRLEVILKLLQNAGIVTRLIKRDHYQFLFNEAYFPFRLLTTSEEAWFSSLVQRSSCMDTIITIATAAKNMGMKWLPARGGFEILETGKVRRVASEEEVFEITKLPYAAPEERNTGPIFSMVQSGLPLPMTRDDLRAWVNSVPWTDTMCGGEAHQFTFRTSVDEREFIRVSEMIREFGYDGRYHRMKWRYLDLDGMFYFSCGGMHETTYVLNRKRLLQPETVWARNPEPWVCLR
ncbi:MAG: hypothetical protein WCO94_01250 [Verrucomicrobiota bacterium]